MREFRIEFFMYLLTIASTMGYANAIIMLVFGE